MDAWPRVGLLAVQNGEPARLLSQFLKGLLAVRIPFGLAFMAVSAIRFVPVVTGEVRAVRTAMRLKGYRPFRRGLVDTIRVEVSTLRPVLAGTIRRSQEVALSILTRGFSMDRPRTSLEDAPLPPRGWIALAGMSAVVTALFVGKTLFWLYRHELYYHEMLRPLYAFAREWL